MDLFLRLFLRILGGERYRKSVKNDYVLGLALLNSLPAPVYLSSILDKRGTLGLFYIWLILSFMGLLAVFLCVCLARLKSLILQVLLLFLQYGGAWYFFESKNMKRPNQTPEPAPPFGASSHD